MPTTPLPHVWVFSWGSHIRIRRHQRESTIFAALFLSGFKPILAPLIWVSGALLLLHPSVLEVIPLGTLSGMHLLVAFLFVVFLIGHIYMTTTGPTPTSHIKTRITGYEEEH